MKSVNMATTTAIGGVAEAKKALKPTPSLYEASSNRIRPTIT